MMSEGLGNVRMNLVSSLDEAWAFKRWLGERHECDIIACDTETGGLNYKRHDLRMVQFGDTQTGWAIPWHDWQGLVKEVLREYEGEMAMHNAPFDVKFLEHNSSQKISWRKLNDTMIMAHIIDPTRAIGLKPLAGRLIDAKAVGSQRILDDAMSKNKWGWGTVPLDFGPYWQYAAMDTILTCRLYQHFEALINPNFIEVYGLEMATLRITSEMERRGCRVDLAYTDKKRRELQDFVDEATEWGRLEHGVNIGSNGQVTKRLIELGYPLSETTGTGAWKFDKEIIQGILGLDDRDNPIKEVADTDAVTLARTAYQSRKSTKIISTYLETFLEVHEDEILHPSIKTVGARTGRMSITAPALQTLPRGPLVRDCFIPREGNVLISTDYDQIEMRLMGHFSKDQGLYDAFNTGDDFFTNLARRIYNDETLVKDDPRRQLTKNAAYGKAYGAGIAKLAATAKVSYDQMKGVNDAFDALYPGVRQFQREVERTAQRRYQETGEAFVIDPFGRKQVAEEDKVYTLVNYLLQGSAGSILKKALVNMDLSGLGDFLILPVHDEALLDVPRESLADVKPIIKECMEAVGDWWIPLTAGIDVMQERWGDKGRKKEKVNG
jgi:DNA polymerase-1